MTIENAILIAVFLPMLAAVPVAVLGGRLGRGVAWPSLLVAVATFAVVLGLAVTHPGTAREVSWPWVPALGLSLSFVADGLSLVFGLVASGVGVLVVFYARFYLSDEYAHQGRFYAYLLLFLGSMLGVVFSSNLLLLFVFWELTGVASFLLIGFLHGEDAARRGARMALLVTGGTGLAGLAGIVMVSAIGGSLNLRELGQADIVSHPLGGVAMVLLLVAAFGKSAQFPFHFWLPNAMAAPTPVSAYLHSATLVKLGVFLVARLFPIFNGHAWWAPMVGSAALLTLLLGAVLALLSHELKAILAWSTVSQLGLLIGYYGLGPPGGVDYDYLHLLNHVFYKGALFMVAGIVYTATHRTDIRQLGGMWHGSRGLAVITAVACAAMLGLPGTTGFLSKELMFKEVFVSPAAHGTLGMFAIAAVVGSSLLKVAFSVRLFAGIFLGRPAAGLEVHAPSGWMLVPPAILAAGAVVLGCAPSLLAGPMHHFNVPGLHSPEAPVLHLWHGINRELIASVAVVAAGGVIAWVGQRTAWRWAHAPRSLRFDAFYDRLVHGLGEFAKVLTRALGSDSPGVWIRVLFGVVVASLGWFLATRIPWAEYARVMGDRMAGSGVPGLRLLLSLLIALGALGAAVLARWTAQLLALSVSGFVTTLYFVLYHGPDLALTQILVETVALVLIALLLARFPLSAQEGELADRRWNARQVFSAAVAVGFGAVMTAIGLLVIARPHPEAIGGWFLANTESLAKGRNAVNTILVDFRGVDTLGEIAVLLIAMLGCLGLLFRRARTAEERRAGPMGAPGYGLPGPEGGQR